MVEVPLVGRVGWVGSVRFGWLGWIRLDLLVATFRCSEWVNPTHHASSGENNFRAMILFSSKMEGNKNEEQGF